MATHAIEGRALDRLLAALNTITGGGSWYEAAKPIIQLGSPPDPLPEPVKPALYLDWIQTEPAEGEAGTSTHMWRLHFVVLITAADVRALLDAKADVARAIFNAESLTDSELNQPFYVGPFVRKTEMEQAGIAIGVLAIYTDTEIPHTAP